MLRPFVLALGDDSSGNVGDANSRVRRVHVLAALTGRSVSVDPQIFFIDDDVNPVVHLRVYGYGCKRGVPAFVRIERRNPDQAMDAGFRRKIAIGVLADHVKRNRLDSGFFTVLIIEHLRLEAILLGPSQIHPHEHLSPVLCLGSAGAGMDIDDSVELVVFTG